MRDEYARELRTILQALRIFTPTSFSFGGQSFTVQPQPGPQPPQLPNGAQTSPQNPLIWQLAQQLYLHCYCRKFDGRLRSLPQVNGGSDDLLDALSAANTTRERWDGGWQIQQVLPAGQVVVHKNGMAKMLWPGEFISQDGPGVPPRVGAMVNVYSPKESRAMQPGFYFAFGESAVEQNDMQDAVRYYWNITPEGAALLTHLLTASLNRFQVHFRFKCLSHRDLFYRIDSAVLYVGRQHYHITAELLVDTYRSMHHYLQPQTPLLTKRLAPGLAFAEEPGTGESFGMSRCRLLAEGIWNGWLQGEQDEHDQLEAIKKQFETNGIPFKHPYLRPGAVDHYEHPTYS